MRHPIMQTLESCQKEWIWRCSCRQPSASQSVWAWARFPLPVVGGHVYNEDKWKESERENAECKEEHAHSHTHTRTHLIHISQGWGEYLQITVFFPPCSYHDPYTPTEPLKVLQCFASLRTSGGSHSGSSISTAVPENWNICRSSSHDTRN